MVDDDCGRSRIRLGPGQPDAYTPPLSLAAGKDGRMTKHRWWFLALLAALSSGCAWDWPTLRRPGPIDYQRNEAQLHDPYPDPDAGPPVVGGRPREFQKP